MSSSCSEDDSDAGRIIPTQYDDDLDLDAQRRQRREAAAKQRQQQIENRRRERERQAEERREKLAQSKRRKRPANSSDDDSDAGSTDLLADKSPAPSPSPSPPRNRISNNNNYNRELNNASPLTSASAKVNSASNNNKTGNGGGIGIIGSGRKPAVKWKPKYYDSSDDDDEQDKFRSSRDNNNGSAAATSTNNTSMNTHSSNGTTKVTSERAKLNAKVAAQKRFGNQSDSDDSDDAGGFEAMRKAMRIKKEREAAKKAAAKSRDSSSPSIPSPEDRKMSYNTTSNTGNSSKNRPTFAAPSSPDTMDVDDSPRIKRPTSRGGVITKSLAQLTQNLQSDSDSDDDGNDMAKLFRERKAKKEAEERAKKEAARRHNPMALEKHEREQREYLNAQNAEDRKRLSPKKPEKSLEGTEIVLRGDDTEEDVNSELGLSQSDMGDDTPNKGGGKGDGFISTKPSRGMYKRRGSAKDDDSDISDTPNKKKQRNSPSKAMQDSFDDGLWDDPSSDQDVRMKMNSDSDSDNGGAKNKRGRGRKRANNGTTQPRKRSRSTKAAADSDDDSDVPAAAQKKKKAPSKKTTRRRRSNSDSDDEPRKRGGGGGGEMPWASRYGIDEDEKSDVSEDERERRKRQLKPDFANPKLGPPGPLVPFVLSKTWRRGDALVGAEDDAVVDDDDEDKKMPAAPDSDADQVPASINRYLKDYQREGVQFIYSSVIKGKGCILGDDSEYSIFHVQYVRFLQISSLTY